MFQAKHDLLHRYTSFAHHARGVEQDEAAHQAQHQMPIIGIFTVDLAGFRRQQVLQGPKDKLNPGAPSPPPDQAGSAHRCRLTKQVVAILARGIDDDHRHRPIGRAGRGQPGIAYLGLPGTRAPGPAWLMHQGVSLHLPAIRQEEHIAWIFHKKAQTSCKSLIEWKV